jgi:uncharacterized cupin superfamily protein
MKIVRSSEVQWGEGIERGNYVQRRKQLGGKQLSAGLWELPPGKKSFPFHAHRMIEEALFVLSGSAKVRTPEGLSEIRAGDFVSFEAGGDAHQIINDGSEALVYIAMSAGMGFDVVDYPDSGKVSTVIGTYPNSERLIFKRDAQVEYFDGDEDAG